MKDVETRIKELEQRFVDLDKRIASDLAAGVGAGAVALDSRVQEMERRLERLENADDEPDEPTKPPGAPKEPRAQGSGSVKR
jgi:hypothetical protein